MVVELGSSRECATGTQTDRQLVFTSEPTSVLIFLAFLLTFTLYIKHRSRWMQRSLMQQLETSTQPKTIIPSPPSFNRNYKRRRLPSTVQSRKTTTKCFRCLKMLMRERLSEPGVP